MKLYKNEEVVNALTDILAKAYDYLEYDAADSKQASNPKGAKRSKDEKDPDVLYVKVRDLDAPRGLGVIYDIVKQLAINTDREYMTGIIITSNGELNWDSKWSNFKIRPQEK